MDKLCDGGDLTVDEAVSSENIQGNHYMPFSELIDKFHKIKAGHGKVRHSLVCDRLSEYENDSLNDNQEQNGNESERPTSARGALGKTSDGLEIKTRSSRRMSLPSIFHPALQKQSFDTVDAQHHTPQPNSVGISCGLSQRRFSMPYVIKEYAKRDLEQLESELPRHAATSSKAAAKDKTIGRGISGHELHAFYNLWEKSRDTPMKKPAVRRLKAMSRDNDTDNSEGRPRTFTF